MILLQTILAMEEKIKNLDDQLRMMHNQRQTVDQQTRRYEIEVRDLQERLRQSERELTNGDAYRTGLRTDKEKVTGVSRFSSLVTSTDNILIAA